MAREQQLNAASRTTYLCARIRGDIRQAAPEIPQSNFEHVCGRVGLNTVRRIRAPKERLSYDEVY
jgi:hypothetical protein